MNSLNLSERVFLFFICVSFLIEGLGIKNGREFLFYSYLLFPIVLYIIDKYSNLNWKLPRSLIYIFSGFFALLCISNILSIEVEASLNNNLLLLSFFIYFIYVYNHKVALEKNLINVLLFLSGFFVIYSTILLIIGNKFRYLIPTGNYQMIYSGVGQHYHFGDFLLIAFVYCLYQYFQKSNKKILIYVFSIFLLIILSYSRSAVLSAIIIAGIFWYKNADFKLRIKTSLILALIAILAILVNYLLYAPSMKTNSLVIKIRNSVQVGNKTLFGDRDVYLQQAEKSIIERPLFGVGSGNYGFISSKFADVSSIITNKVTATSHNIFLDLFVENGIFTFLFIIIAIFYLIRFGKDNLWRYIFLVLLINFQSDYTFEMYIFLLLLYISIVYTYVDDDKKLAPSGNVPVLILSILSLILILPNLLIFMHIYDYRVFFINPINKGYSQVFIEKKIRNKDYGQALFAMNLSAKVRQGDEDYMSYIASNFEKFGNNKAAAIYYESACNASSYSNCLFYFKKIDSLDRELLKDGQMKSKLMQFIDMANSKYKNYIEKRDYDSGNFLLQIFSINKWEGMAISRNINGVIKICKDVDKTCRYNFY